MALADESPVEIAESGLAYGTRALAPVALGLVAASGFWLGGDRIVVPSFFLVMAVVAAAVVLFDAPRKVVMSRAGVYRHCLLRTHFFDWEVVSALERAPTPPRKAGGWMERRVLRHEPRPRAPEGLVLRVGKKRRYLLLNRPERPDQWDALSSRVAIWAPHVSIPRRPPV